MISGKPIASKDVVDVSEWVLCDANSSRITKFGSIVCDFCNKRHKVCRNLDGMKDDLCIPCFDKFRNGKLCYLPSRIPEDYVPLTKPKYVWKMVQKKGYAHIK